MTFAEFASLLGRRPDELEDELAVLARSIADGIRDGRSVAIPGFGTFVWVHRSAGMNPQTGESIPASRVVRFIADITLARSIGTAVPEEIDADDALTLEPPWATDTLRGALSTALAGEGTKTFELPRVGTVRVRRYPAAESELGTLPASATLSLVAGTELVEAAAIARAAKQ